GGSMTGGSVSRSAGILSRANELKELTARRGTLEEKLAAAAREAEEAKRELTKAQYELEVAQSQQRAAEEAVLKLDGEKKHYDILLAALRGRLEDMDRESETIERRETEMRRSLQEKETLGEKQEQEAAALRTQAEEKLSGQSDLLRSSSRLGEEITEHKSTLSGYCAEREATEQALANLEALREQMRGDEDSRRSLIEQYRAANEAHAREREQHTQTIAALRAQAQEKKDRLASLGEAKMALEAQRSQSDKRGRELNDNVLNVERAVSKLEQKRATGAMEEKQILDKLWENYELSHSAAMEQRVELESLSKANRRIGELKRAIGALGSVNVGAIDDFERVNTRYTYLTTQRNDVDKAKEELLGVIESITREMTGIFAEQFALIRESFQQTFLELFGGGKATLELEDENDILNCGIEIKVQPPGKALKTITLLSGGEKAFVAIALYFAILKVHPTPFCVMDEIEAALDESNVIRVANYMRRITGKTQFIVITHRRGTMEAADVLYGVTMQERGVSKVLTINMNDMAKELNIKE
ncbi:MAG: chromosome segregation protein SMC, partial [Oscillospiraceae bacterium]|nr:chromosome segregation protein SMC [Oscillospiraceae bacterium]